MTAKNGPRNVIKLQTGAAAQRAREAAEVAKAREMAKDPDAVGLAYLLTHDPPASWRPPERKKPPTRKDVRLALSQLSTRLYWLARARLYRLENLEDPNLCTQMVARASMLADDLAHIADLIAAWERANGRPWSRAYFCRYRGPAA